MEKIRAGIVGVGMIGNAHIEALRRLGYVDVAAVCKRRGAQEQAEAHCIPQAFEDYKDMIDNGNIDVVHVCTPNYTHFEIAKYALEHGKHVLCEKPITFTIAEAQELTELAAKNSLVNGVNLHYRAYPMVRQMRELIAKGDLGRIFSIHGGYFQDWLLYDTDYSWRLESAQSGSSRAVADIGSHWFDTAEFVTGMKIKRVFADFATFYDTRKKPTKAVTTFSNKVETCTEYEEYKVDTEDYAQVLLEFENGSKGDMIVTQTMAGRKNQLLLAVSGSQQAMELDTERDLNGLWVGRRDGYNSYVMKDASLLEPGAAALCAYPGGHIEGFPDAFVQNFRAFYDEIRTGKKSFNAQFADGLREMVLCDAVVRSAKEGRWVTVE